MVWATFSAWWSGLHPEAIALEPMTPVQWQTAPLFSIDDRPDPALETLVQGYLEYWQTQGHNPDYQGVWLESDWVDLASNQGTLPQSAASITKVATSLAALERWGPHHRFLTRVYHSGKRVGGTIEGDLIIMGEGDPLLVWEEAIAMAAALQGQGIEKITGKLMVVGDLPFNFQTQTQTTAQNFHRAFHEDLWSPQVKRQYQAIAAHVPPPRIWIQGGYGTAPTMANPGTLVLTHQSLPMGEILKKMNIYSNNAMAQTLADRLGTADDVAKMAATAAGVPPGEIQLINGSGLGVENRISPRAACGMFRALEVHFQPLGIQVADLFPVTGRDHQGTMSDRQLPQGVALKTGTLNQVSALAGLIPTSDRGTVCFALLNYGNDIMGFRRDQDRFLQDLANHWQFTPDFLPKNENLADFFGNPQRNLPPQTPDNSPS